MELPYNVERRPDTGVNNVTLGIWLFLASEVMLFGGLFSAYVLLRGGSPDWPAGSTVSSVAIGGLNTALLLTSSVVIALARRAAAEGNESRARMLLAATAAIGVVFLGIKGFRYWTKFEHGLYPSTSTFLAVYFLLTSVHALHVPWRRHCRRSLRAFRHVRHRRIAAALRQPGWRCRPVPGTSLTSYGSASSSCSTCYDPSAPACPPVHARAAGRPRLSGVFPERGLAAARCGAPWRHCDGGDHVVRAWRFRGMVSQAATACG